MEAGVTGLHKSLQIFHELGSFIVVVTVSTSDRTLIILQSLGAFVGLVLQPSPSPCVEPEVSDAAAGWAEMGFGELGWQGMM